MVGNNGTNTNGSTIDMTNESLIKIKDKPIRFEKSLKVQYAVYNGGNTFIHTAYSLD